MLKIRIQPYQVLYQSVAGKNTTSFISSSYRFDKEAKNIVIFNGQTCENCMEMKGNNSKVKFLLNKYNYIYFEITKENYLNETYRKNLDYVLKE